MNNRTVLIIVSLAAIGAAASATATSGVRGLGVQEIVRNIKSTYDATRSADVRFEQSGRTGVSSGSLEFSGPERYRIDIGQQSIVSDGSTVWTFTPARNQVVLSRAGAGRGGLTPRDILTRFPGTYKTTLVRESKIGSRPVYVLKCIAAGEKIGDVTEATLFVDRSTYRLHRIELVSPTLGAITVRVVSARYNVTIPDSRFTFRPPAGARVVDLRR